MTETATPQAAPVKLLTVEDRAAEARPTPLATFLAEKATRPELVAYLGALTPHKLDAQERETTALVAGVAVHDLGWVRRVAVLDEDRFRWLSGMVTNTVNDLALNAGAWNLVLNAQGRIQGDLHVWRDGDKLDLTIAADQYDRLLAHLNRFIIMDDVELTPENDTALGLAGPLAASVLTRLGLPDTESMTSVRAEWNGPPIRVVRTYGALAPHYELWVQPEQIPALWKALTDAGAAPVGAATLTAFRIAEGIPTYGIDIAGRDLPQETSQMRGLSFNKGCYLGQEIVERIRSRGNVHRHLRSLELFGAVPAAGTELTSESGVTAGQITSAAELPLASGRRVFALGMIRGEVELSNQPLSYSTEAAAGTARILSGPTVSNAG
jgi:folate-binding protein YgfZ